MGQAKRGKLRQSTDQSLQIYLPGVENVGHRSNVGVRERVSLCVRALLSLQGANFRA